MTLVGDLPRPRKRAEYLYVIFELLVGLFVLASVLGHVANIVTNVSAARKEFQGKCPARQITSARRAQMGLRKPET